MEEKRVERLDELERESSFITDPKLERRIVGKLDLFVLPTIMILYIVSFLDRANIGNAKIAGLPEEVGLTGNEFNVITSIFYVTYIIFDIPVTMLVKEYGPSRVLPAITLAWSLVAIFAGFVESYASLIVVRLLLGICEAGLFPGLNFYVSLLWKRNEISKRVCSIFVALALSGAFGGLLAYAITKMDGAGGKSGWRWLFIIEGLASFVWGVACFWLLPDSPDKAYFLNAEEKEYARMRIESEYVYKDNQTHMSWQDVVETLKSTHCWISGIIQLGANTYLFAFSIFLPTIIQGLGYDSIQAQYLTIPVYICGALCYFIVSIFADKYQKRFVFMFAASFVVFIGYAVLLGSRTQKILFMATFFVAAGGYIIPGLNMTWLNANTAGPYKRAAAIGFNQSIGNIGGVISSYIYRPQDNPRYVIGHGTSMGGCGLALVGMICLYFVFRHKNTQKRQGRGVDGRGDESREFIYVM